jgi:hypothetical protein
MDKLDCPVLLIDGDIYAYRAASAADGRMYTFEYNMESSTVIVREKYKKDIDKRHKDMQDQGLNPSPVLQSFEPDPVEHALHTLKKSIESLETDLKDRIINGCTKEIYLSQGESFRNTEVYAGYKKNRDGMRKPFHLDGCKEYLVKKFGAIVKPGLYEADDLIAIRATQLASEGKPYIIVTLDKDLRQVPGYHWNFNKQELSYVSEVEAKRNLYKQILTGDATDGIPGLYGVGPKRADALLDPLLEDRSMYLAVLKEYLDKMPKTVENHAEFCAALMHTHAHLLYLLRSEDERWVPPALT